MQKLLQQTTNYKKTTENQSIRAKTIQHYFDTKQYCLAPKGLKDHLRQSSLSSGAKACFDFLLDEVTFSLDYSTQIPRDEIADKLLKHPNTVSKLLLELEGAGYIIRKLNPSKASTIYINLPTDAIAALEASPSRKKAKAIQKIQKCGTIPEQSTIRENKTKVTISRSPQKREGDLLKNESLTLYNTNQYKYNNNKELTNEQKFTSSNDSVVVFSDDEVLASQSSKSQPIEKLLLSTELSEIDSKISSLDNLLKLDRSQEPALEAQRLELQEKQARLQTEFQDMGDESKGESVEKSCSIQPKQMPTVKPDNEEFNKQQKKILETKLNMLEQEQTRLICSYGSCDYTALRRKIDMVGNEKGKIELEIKKLLGIDKKVERIKCNDYLVGKGQRKFSVELVSWLKDEIKEIDSTADDVKIFEIANQMAYQVRFGNLQISYKTGKVMDEYHGLCVALKKLRQKVWSKPTGMVRA